MNRSSSPTTHTDGPGVETPRVLGYPVLGTPSQERREGDTPEGRNLVVTGKSTTGDGGFCHV